MQLDVAADTVPPDSLPGWTVNSGDINVVAAHINDAAFSAKALEIFDRWVAEGIVPPGVPAGRRAA